MRASADVTWVHSGANDGRISAACAAAIERRSQRICHTSHQRSDVMFGGISDVRCAKPKYSKEARRSVSGRSVSRRGISDPTEAEERLASLISDAIVPRLLPEIEILPWRDTQVLAVEFYPS